MLAKIRGILFSAILIAAGLGGGYALWGYGKEAPPAHVVRIAEAFPNRQFIVEVTLGDEVVPFIVDTGATSVVVSPAVAEKLRLETIGESAAMGVGGMAPVKVVRIPEMRIGPIVVRDIAAIVIPQNINLLGMTFLEQLRRVEIKGSILTLEQ